MFINSIQIFQDRFPTNEFYPFNIDLFNNTKNVSLDSSITFFIGENGSGKSTLLKAIAKKCGIHLWENNERIRYQYNRYEEELNKCIELSWIDDKVPGSFFSAETFRNFAEILDEWAVSDKDMLKYFGGETLVKKSHGQCNMAYFKNRYKIKGIYLLDEPESALSPKKQLEFIEILKESGESGNAQFIIATHSPLLLSIPDTRIFSFDGNMIKLMEYKETDYFKIYKDFLDKC